MKQQNLKRVKFRISYAPITGSLSSSRNTLQWPSCKKGTKWHHWIKKILMTKQCLLEFKSIISMRSKLQIHRRLSIKVMGGGRRGILAPSLNYLSPPLHTFPVKEGTHLTHLNKKGDIEHVFHRVAKTAWVCDKFKIAEWLSWNRINTNLHLNLYTYTIFRPMIC